MIIVDYYDLPSDMNQWFDEEKELYRYSCKNYHELKIKLSKEFPELYSDVIEKIDLIKILDDNIELAIILAMSNKLSHERKHLNIALLVQDSERLTPKVIGYYYQGLLEEEMEYV